MSKKRLIQDLEDYQAYDINEEACRQLILQFLNEEDNNFDRSNKGGHITGSAWVVNKERTHVLLIHHKASNIWMQAGGHCDGETIVQKVSKREAHEETGIQKLKALSPLPFDIGVHQIAPRKDKVEGEHVHYDIRYLFEGDMTAPLTKQEEEIDAVKWFSLEEIEGLKYCVDIERMLAKTHALK